MQQTTDIILLYATGESEISPITVKFHDGRLWMDAPSMQTLLGAGKGKDYAAYQELINRVIKEEGFDKAALHSKADFGKFHYPIDFVISLAYRIAPAKATRLRLWINEVLEHYHKTGKMETPAVQQTEKSAAPLSVFDALLKGMLAVPPAPKQAKPKL